MEIGKIETYTHELSLLIYALEDIESELSDKISDTKENKRNLSDAMALLTKVRFHASSILALSRKIKVTSSGAEFTDNASMTVLARALYETVLVFHHLFADNVSASTRQYRFDCWRLAGLKSRQKFPHWTPLAQAKLAAEKRELEHLRAKIESNPSFVELKKGTQKDILKGQWRAPYGGWPGLAKRMKLATSISSKYYSYLSELAHSGSISVIQIRDAKTEASRIQLSKSSLSTTVLFTSLMILLFAEVAPETLSVLEYNRAVRRVIEDYGLMAESFKLEEDRE